jgi:hypothetical protein
MTSKQEYLVPSLTRNAKKSHMDNMALVQCSNTTVLALCKEVIV